MKVVIYYKCIITRMCAFVLRELPCYDVVFAFDRVTFLQLPASH
jgi:hypothetical protein